VPKVFLDTNVLVYALDQDDTEKQNACRAILRRLQDTNGAVISTQIMQEFYVVATRKLGVEPLRAKSILQALGNLEVVPVSPSLVYEAIDCSLLNQISFRDALAIVSAESARCTLVLSEDLNDGQIIKGVKVQTPFTWGGSAFSSG
jgi:predicted nucleic acid-binding protein